MNTYTISEPKAVPVATVGGIADKLRAFVIENFMFGDKSTPLQNSDSFLDKGIIDSTGVLELVSFIEEQYGIVMQDEELVPENLDSIDNLVLFVQGKLSAAAGGR